MRALVPACFGLLLVSIPAAAQNSNVQEADRLFEAAKALTDKGNYEEACPKYARSFELDVAIGTEFNLADCYEHTGRNAAAYVHYRHVYDLAHAAGKVEREKAASERIAVLEGKLGWLRVNTGKPLSSFLIDGAPAPTALNKGVPVDPGSRALSVTANDGSTESQTVQISAGQSLELDLFRADSATGPIAPESGNEALRPPKDSQSSGGRAWQKPVGLGVGAVGIVGLIVGGGAGVASIINRGAANDACPQYPACSGNADFDGPNDRALTAGTISTIGFIAGGVLVAAGAVLYFTAPKKADTTSAKSVYIDAQGVVHF